jgi:hypothetical protein
MSEKPHPSRRRWGSLLKRGLGMLALSLLLHLFALQWVGGHIGLPAMAEQEAPTVAVELRPAPAPLPAPTPQVAAEQPAKPARPRPRKRTPPAEPVASPAEPAAVGKAAADAGEAGPVDSAASAGESAPDAAAQPDQGPLAAPAPQVPTATQQPTQEATPADEPPHYRVRTPPPVALNYNVESLREGQTVYGHGKIAWRTDGAGYRVDGEAGVLFFTVLNFQSRGVMDEFGVAPELYSEKRFRRAETATHFRRDTGRISFSASTASYPRHGGEQDRASIVWQLAAIGLGDPGQYAPGAQLQFFVAGVRDAEPWRIQVIGLERVDTPAGATEAWHVMRLPRPGSYEQKLDIWLAPQRSWYPVRLRFTETNGDYLDMALSSVESPDAQ